MYQIRSVAQLCPTLCDPMNRSMPGLPIHHQLPEFTQTHIHRVSDAIKPSHPLSSPSPPTPNPFQHQSFPMSQLFAWGGQNTGVSALASFLPKKSQDWSSSEWAGWISLQSKAFSRVFSNTILDISNSKSVNNGCSLFPKCFYMEPFFQIGQKQRLSITLSFFFYLILFFNFRGLYVEIQNFHTCWLGEDWF